MLGDSVMIGAEEKLASRLGPGFSMDAKVGRQADEFLEIIEKIKRDGHHPDAMVIQWGNNGPLYSEDMEALRKATTNVGQLFLISDHAPVSWQDESNEAIAEASEDLAPHHRNPLGKGGRRRRRKPLLGRHPPDPEGRRRLRPPGLQGPPRKGRVPRAVRARGPGELAPA